jgi:hypothetical protein
MLLHMHTLGLVIISAAGNRGRFVLLEAEAFIRFHAFHKENFVLDHNMVHPPHLASQGGQAFVIVFLTSACA